jgi:protein SCO1/2
MALAPRCGGSLRDPEGARPRRPGATPTIALAAVPRRREILLFAVGMLALVGIGFGLYGLSSERERSETAPGVERSARAERFAGSLMPAGVRAPDFRLRDQDGRPVSMSSRRGRPVIVTFLYTTCEESCPAQAQQIKLALDRLGEDVPALAVAVEPETDTPESAKRFLRKQGMVGRMDFVLGSRAQLEPVWKDFAVHPQLPDAEHQARTVLIDARGFQRIGFPVDQLTPERLARDLRRLLAEERHRPRAS